MVLDQLAIEEPLEIAAGDIDFHYDAYSRQ
jgi:hypothetical protein